MSFCLDHFKGGCLSIGAERARGAERVSIAERSCGLCLSIDAERDSGAEPASIAERSNGLCGARPSSRNESFERRAAGGQFSHTRLRILKWHYSS